MEFFINLKMAKIIIFTAAVFLFASGCACVENFNKPLKAIAVITGLEGVNGNVTFTQNGCGEAVLIEVYVLGLSPGEHGFHVHEKGDLSNGCLSTGGHYNPDKMDHGAPTDEIRHVGDLGNIRANENGYAETKFSDQVITLAGMRSILGRAVVIHGGADDLGRTNHPDSKKTGNAGGRAGCGVIGIIDPSSGDWPSSATRSTVISTMILFFILVNVFHVI